nr:MAG TPA: hypothetical protein [Caudoviricetes sp.]
MNIMQLINALQNPQQFAQQMMNNSQVMQNPMAKNAVQMLQKGDSQGIESMARNLCKEKGIDPEEMMKQFKQQLNIK